MTLPLAGEDNYGVPPQPLQREEMNSRLVRLDTTFREQLADEGWETSNPDGFLTEDELIQAARSQGILKRRSRNWRLAALLALAWLLLSCATILAAVLLATHLIQDTKIDPATGLLTTAANGNPIQVAAGTDVIPLFGWSESDPSFLMQVDRILLVPANGSILGMRISFIDANFNRGILTMKTPSGGEIVLHNNTLHSVNIGTSTLASSVKKGQTFTRLLSGKLMSIVGGQIFVKIRARTATPLLRFGKCLVGNMGNCH